MPFPLTIPPATPPEWSGRGRVFGRRFRADKLLKHTATVQTILGFDLHREHPVIIKTATEAGLAPGEQMRLEHEAEVLRRLQSPFIAPLLQLGHENGVFFLVMPQLPGITLEARLQHAPLSVAETLRLGCCVIEGLLVAHRNGILHRDIKPANVIVDDGNELRKATIVDFGLSRSARLDASIRDEPVGTARYMSPEMAGLIESTVDERADLYSTGVMLYECLAGTPPFSAKTVNEVLRQHMTLKPAELRGLGFPVPRALDEVIQRLLRKDPNDRYQMTEAVLADLRALSEAVERGIEDPSIVVGQHDRRRSLTEPNFIGRDQELGVLKEELKKARNGLGGLVYLEAESGSGKTRLLTEFARRSTLEGAWVLHGQALDQAPSRPFPLLVGVAEEIRRACVQDNELAPRIRRRLSDHLETVCAALPELSDILEVQVRHELGPESFGEVRTLHALSLLLDALGSATKPAIIVLDDCQWGDELTFQLLSHWHRRDHVKQVQNTGSSPMRIRRHVLLVSAYRSEEVPAEHPLRRFPPQTAVLLTPFDKIQVRQLIESMAGPLPNEAVAIVQQLSGGSPFMAGAVLQGMVESGALISETKGWRVEPLEMQNVQSSRHAAAFLARRVELLPADAVRLLTAGALLGKEFDLVAAAHLADQNAGQAISALDEACRRHMIWAKQGDSRCIFLHDKLRQTLLEQLPDPTRKSLHLRAATFLKDHGQDQPFELAYHYDAAGEHEQALPYAQAAAELARKRHALQIAQQQYCIAERGWGNAPAKIRCELAQGHGQILMLRGQYDAAAVKLAEALDLASDKMTQARIEGTLGELAFKRGDIKTAEHRIESALGRLGRSIPRWNSTLLLWTSWEIFVQCLHTAFPTWFTGWGQLQGAETDLLAIRLYSRLGHLYWFQRGSTATLWAHLRDMNLAERYPTTPELAQAYSEHAPAMSLIPLFERGIAYAKKSLVIRKERDDLWGQGQTLHFYGIVLYAASRYQDAIEKCREAVRLLERTGDFWELNIARYQIAASLYRQGNLRAAMDEARKMYQSGLDLGDAQTSGISLDILARASLGQVDEEMIRVELERPTGDCQRMAQVLAAEGTRLLHQNRLDEAGRTLARADEIARKGNVRNAWVSPIPVWLTTALRMQLEQTTNLTPQRRLTLFDQARQASHRALKLARSFQNDLPHALRESAMLAAMQGQYRQAQKLFGESLEVADRQGARYEYALSLHARSKIGLELGWSHAVKELARAEQSILSIESQVRTERLLEANEHSRVVTWSLVDRFDTVLEVGRTLASALSRQAIFAAVREATLKLLRAENCIVLSVHDLESLEVTAVSGELQTGFSIAMVRQALSARRTIAFVEGIPDDNSESVLLSGVRSALCAPIFVRGRLTACFYAMHRHIIGLFGKEEKRLADFIATIAGAALENAEGFAELHRLNAQLEQKMAERKLAEKQIQEQAALLDRAHDTITVRDMEDRILYWNQSAERLYGWSADEARGQVATQILYRVPSVQEQQATTELLDKGEWTGELQQMTKTGKDIVLQSRWSLVRDEDGAPKAKLIVCTDITDRKMLEAQFQRVQRMESIGRLAAGIAHDMNNVLTPVMMSVDLLKMKVKDPQANAILDDLRSSAQHGAEMVKQILSFSRGLKGQRVDMNIRTVSREVEKLLEHTLPKTIKLKSQVSKDLWSIYADPTQIHQLIMNLGVNARDAMPEGGTLTISASNVFLDSTMVKQHVDAKQGPYVILSVADTGTGIPAEVLDKIFDPFFTTKTVGKGTGLGLSTVMGIVKSAGGFIELKTAVGKGTQFSVYLPANSLGKTTDAPVKTIALPRGKGQTVLVVDDEPGIRIIIQKTLEANGYRVLSAANGTDAWTIFQEQKEVIDIVLTDMMMPGMDGPQLVNHLLSLSPELPIVAISGLMVDSEERSKIPEGVKGFLAKPFSTEELLQVLASQIPQPART